MDFMLTANSYGEGKNDPLNRPHQRFSCYPVVTTDVITDVWKVRVITIIYCLHQKPYVRLIVKYFVTAAWKIDS